ncbi:NAD-dependent epimerase/dehydratase family protein [Lentzea sp. NPDC005914]|uniref:NAD-dependent epimerase/dehydratase family protein n=1 Tax=Lentzea sp. NPDC005914 TaxID=3154572 RepID=UPI0033C4BDCE
MRHLLLGGAGFIGLHLARRLLADGHDVTVVDDFSRGRRDPELDALGVPVISADLTDPASFVALPRDCEHVHLLAAVVGVRNVERDPSRVVRINTLVVLNTLEWITAPQRLFFASTSETYAGGVATGVVPVPTPETVPLVVEDVTAPRFAYAVSKMLGEAAVVHAGRAKGVPVVVGRFHNVYGPRMGTDHVIPELSLRALRREDPFVVYGTDQHRAFCYVDDAVEAVVRLTGTDAAAGRIVHIGDDTAETNIGELAELVLKIAGHAPVVEKAPAPPGSVARRCPDLTLLRDLTGYAPSVSLDEGVRRTFDWYRS